MSPSEEKVYTVFTEHRFHPCTVSSYAGYWLVVLCKEWKYLHLSDLLQHIHKSDEFTGVRTEVKAELCWIIMLKPKCYYTGLISPVNGHVFQILGILAEPQKITKTKNRLMSKWGSMCSNSYDVSSIPGWGWLWNALIQLCFREC